MQTAERVLQQTPTRRGARDGVLIGRKPSVLRAIERPDRNLAIWRRDPEPRVAQYLESADLRRMPGLTLTVAPALAPDQIGEAFEERGLPDGAERDLWIDDMAAHVELFARLAGVPVVRMKLDVLSHDECHLFHVDNVHLRLLCTYLGPGTEWLGNRQVAREQLGKGCNEHVIRYGGPERIPTWAVAVLKGERYPGNEGAGVVHRSPLIEADGLARVRLRLDLPGWR